MAKINNHNKRHASTYPIYGTKGLGKIAKQARPAFILSREAKDCIQSMLTDSFNRLSDSAATILELNNRSIVTPEIIYNSAKTILPFELQTDFSVYYKENMKQMDPIVKKAKADAKDKDKNKNKDKDKNKTN